MRRQTRVRASIGQLFVLLFLATALGCSGFDVKRNVSSLAICTSPLCLSSTKTVTLVEGQPRQVFAAANYVDGSSKDVTGSTLWLSSDQTCATVGAANGLIEAATALSGACSSTVTATFAQTTSSTTVIVTPGTLLSIELVPSTTTLAGGSTMTFTALGIYSGVSEPQDITTLVAWRTDNNFLTLLQGSGSAVVAVAPNQITHVSASFLGISSQTVTITVQ
jgi:hypothetical protein